MLLLLAHANCSRGLVMQCCYRCAGVVGADGSSVAGRVSPMSDMGERILEKLEVLDCFWVSKRSVCIAIC